MPTSRWTDYTKCETCGRYCEKTGGSEFACNPDAKVIPIDAVMGRDWKEHLPTDEEWEEDAYQEYVSARDWWLANPEDPAAAWQFLYHHPANRTGHGVEGYSRFKDNLDIDYVYVNPETDHVDDDDSLNTKPEVWLEWGPFDVGEQMNSHDVFCDTGGDNFEEAICSLAELVWRKYKDANHVIYLFAPNINVEWFVVEGWYLADAVPGARVEVHNVNHYLDENSNLVRNNPFEPMMLLGHIVDVDGSKVRIEIEEKVSLDEYSDG